jgi:hypothetical protein
VAVPIIGEMLRFVFVVASIGWEVVQLVGHQTLTLGILVRVQASQPNLSRAPFNLIGLSLPFRFPTT